MTKGTKIFRIAICILLALTMLCCAFFSLAFYAYLTEEVAEKEYGIYVAGVPVTRQNRNDVLGDGTVYYNAHTNVLTLDNATIEYAYTTVYSKIDLNMELIGENTFIGTGEGYSIGIYAGNNNLAKDLAIAGDGSLTIEIRNPRADAAGISASNLTFMTDVAVIMPDCESSVHGIICDSSLLIVDGATVTVNNGSAKYSSAVRVRGNALMEAGTTLKVSVNPGSSGACKGLNVSGDLVLGQDASLDVAIDDGATDLGECIRVSGLLEFGNGSAVTASAKNAPAIECFGTIEANAGAAISAVSEKNDADIFCSGAVIDRGAQMDGTVDAIGGLCHRAVS